MPARQERQPLVDIRRRRRADGSVEEIPTVRYWDAAGKRRRLNVPDDGRGAVRVRSDAARAEPRGRPGPGAWRSRSLRSPSSRIRSM
jgi:hypothetical protein